MKKIKGNLPKEGFVRFNCDIPLSLFVEIKKGRMKYSYIVEEGFKYLSGRSQTNDRISEIEKKAEKFEKMRVTMQTRIYELEADLKRVSPVPPSQK